MFVSFRIKVGEFYFLDFKYKEDTKSKFPGHTKLGTVLDYDGITGIRATEHQEKAEFFIGISAADRVKIIYQLMKYDILPLQNITLEVLNGEDN